METVKSIKENVNVQTALENDKYDIFEGVSENEIKNILLETEIVMMLKTACKNSSYKVSYSVTIESFEITNENVISMFNELEKISKNTFVKSVLETVLNSNKLSQKQIDVIVSEIVKHENLTLNF